MGIFQKDDIRVEFIPKYNIVTQICPFLTQVEPRPPKEKYFSGGSTFGLTFGDLESHNGYLGKRAPTSFIFCPNISVISISWQLFAHKRP